MYIFHNFPVTICIIHRMHPQVLQPPEYGCGLRTKHVGASKLCIVQFVGNRFVCTTVQGLVEIGEVFNLKTKLK